MHSNNKKAKRKKKKLEKVSKKPYKLKNLLNGLCVCLHDADIEKGEKEKKFTQENHAPLIE